MITRIHVRTQALVLLMLLPGCHSAGTARDATPLARGLATSQWESDADLERQLTVLRPNLIATSAGKRVEFTLQNSTPKPLEIFFAVAAYDRSGKRLPPGQPHWSPLRLAPGAAADLKVELGSPLCESWRLYVHRPNAAGP